ncbi:MULTISPECIES: hypothetical protein [unclassified Bacillus cereus group]|uniref:hypothetical protein n=6 Tax=Bacillus TaxID=1386 RepID=UPI001F5A5A30
MLKKVILVGALGIFGTITANPFELNVEASVVEQDKEVVEGTVVEVKDAVEGYFVLEVDISKSSLPPSVKDNRIRVYTAYGSSVKVGDKIQATGNMFYASNFNQELVKLMHSDIKTIQKEHKASVVEQDKEVVEGIVVEVKDAVEGYFVLEVDTSKSSLPPSVKDNRIRVYTAYGSSVKVGDKIQATGNMFYASNFSQESVKLMHSDIKTIQKEHKASVVEQDKEVVEGTVVEVRDTVEGYFVLEVDTSKSSLPPSVKDNRIRVYTAYGSSVKIGDKIQATGNMFYASNFNQESVKLMHSDVKKIQNL